MLALLNTLFAYAINGRTTYQARIIKPDGLPLQSSSVNFRFTVLDQSGSCVLYVEDYAAINMTDTSGLISFPLGTGARSFPTSGTSQTFQNTFDNSITSFACQTMGIYNPNPTDTRKIVMQFNDGSGWQTLPAMSINAVPYAMFATRSDNSRALNGKADTAFVEYSALNGLGCAADQAIKYNGVSFSCITVGSSGTAVTSSTVIAALGYTPAQGTSFTSLDSTVTSVSSAVYSVSSTVSNLNNSVTSLSSSVAASFAAITSSQWVTSGTFISYSSGNVGIGTSNPVTKLDVSGGVRISMEVATCSASYAGTLRYNSDTVEYCNGTSWLPFGVAGAGVTNVNGSTSGSQTFATGITGTVFNISSANGVHTFNIPLAASSSVVAGLLSNSDYSTFMNKMNATSAAITSALGYTPATSATVSTLQSDLSTVSAAANNALVKTNNLSDLTNMATARTNLGLGSLATANGIDLGSASATGTLADARLPNQSGVTSGTQYTKVTVDGKGRVISGSQVTLNDIVHVYTANGGLFVGSGTSRPLVDDSNTAESTAFGVNSMAANQSGGQNTAFGFATLESSVTSYENAAFGWYALQANTTGQFNTAIGAETMWRNTTGVENTAVGGAALQDLTTGNYNSALGMVAGGNIVSGSENVFVGIGAGRGATSANASKNTIVGGWAGSVINTGADNNVILGYQSGGNLTTGSSNILIGYNVNAITATASQTLNIGNIIFGSGLNGVGQNISSGSIGIGIKSPTAKLHLASGSASMAPLKFSSGTLLASPQSGTMEYDGTNFYVTDGSNQRRTIATGSSTGSIDNASTINSSGNITLTPTGSVIVSSTTASTSYNNGALVVQGGVGIAGDLNVAGTISGSAQVKATGYRANQGAPNAGDSSTNGYSFGADGDTGIFSPGSGGANGVIAFYNNDVERVRIDPSGNVGIGTASAGTKLDIDSSTSTTFLRGSYSGGQTLQLAAGSNGAAIVQKGNGVLSFHTNSDGNMSSPSNERMRIDNSGNVGMGTMTPAYKLSVYEGSGNVVHNIESGNNGSAAYTRHSGKTAGGVARTFGNGLNISDGNGAYEIYDFTAGASRMYVNSSGNIGIGTTNPVAKLSISSGTAEGIEFFPGNGAGVDALQFYNRTAGTYDVARLIADSYRFETAGTERMRLTSSGAVGVGTSTPSTKLEVYGTAGPYVGQKISGPGSGAEGLYLGQVSNMYNYIGGNSFYNNVNLWQAKDTAAGSIRFTDGDIGFYADSGLTIDTDYTPTNRMVVKASGNVGIGTTNPVNPFQTTITSGAGSPYVGINQTADNPFIELQRWTGTGSNYEGVRLKNIVGSGGQFAIETTQNGGAAIGSQTFTERMRIVGGNVGIGTTNPVSRLHISDDVKTNAGTSLVLSSTESSNAFQLVMNRTAAGASAAYKIQSVEQGIAYRDLALQPDGGNVGIGTNTPNSKLDVNGIIGTTWGTAFNTSFNGTWNQTTTGYAGLLQFEASTGKFYFWNTPASATANSANPFPVQSMTIDKSGNVGIGTASPSNKLEVNGNILSTAGSIGMNLFNGSFSNNTNRAYLDGTGYIWSTTDSSVTSSNLYLHRHNTSAYFVQFGYGASNVGSISTNGSSVSYNTTSDYRLKENVTPMANSVARVLRLQPKRFNYKTSPNQKIDGFIAHEVSEVVPEAVQGKKDAIDKDGNIIPQLVDYSKVIPLVAGAVREIAQVIDVSKADKVNPAIAIDHSNVGIGTTSSGYKLDVNGTIRGFGITDSSDIRLKKNVMPLDLSLEKILQIEGVSYNWIDKERSEKKQIGFIAQQLEKIYPELVETDKQGMKSVNYSHLVAPLVEAFKVLYEKVSGVEREIASLKAENEELKSKVKEFDELKAYICKKDPEAPNCKPAQ